MDTFDILLDVDYTSKDIVQENIRWLRYETKRTSAKPLRILRQQRGVNGSGAMTYNYTAWVHAPDDALIPAQDGTIPVNINRERNPHFNPKDFEFIGNRADPVAPKEERGL